MVSKMKIGDFPIKCNEYMILHMAIFAHCVSIVSSVNYVHENHSIDIINVPSHRLQQSSQ